MAESIGLADDLAQAQAGLSRGIALSRAGEQRDLAPQLREKGEQLVAKLAAFLKPTAPGPIENKSMETLAEETLGALTPLVDLLGTVRLVTVDDQVYLNDLRIRTDGRGGGKDLGRTLMRHNVGGLSFHSALPVDELMGLRSAFLGEPSPVAPRRALADQLSREGLSSIALSGISRVEDSSEEPPRSRGPADVATRLRALVADSFERVASGREIDPVPLRRVVLEVIDVGLGASAFWAPSKEGPGFVGHAVEVALVALLTGRAAGLSPYYLSDLGIAALVHDIGYLRSAPGEDPASLQKHGLEGARVLLRKKGFHEAKVRRVRAVLEHHRDYSSPLGRPSLGGALLRLAEDYANAIRFYGTKVTRPDVLGAIVRAGGTLYDPVLAQLMVNSLGAFPPGTFLLLGDGRLVRVAAPPTGPERFHVPLVQYTDPATRLPAGELFDLSPAEDVREVLPG